MLQHSGTAAALLRIHYHFRSWKELWYVLIVCAVLVLLFWAAKKLLPDRSDWIRLAVVAAFLLLIAVIFALIRYLL